MSYCQILSCENNRGRQNDNCYMFRASCPEVAQQWKNAIQNLGLRCSGTPGGKTLTVCMLHFHPDDIIGIKRRVLRKHSVPSLRSSQTEYNRTSDGETSQTQTHSIEPTVKLPTEIKTEPIESSVRQTKPPTHRFNYSKQSNQTEAPAIIPVVEINQQFTSPQRPEILKQSERFELPEIPKAPKIPNELKQLGNPKPPKCVKTMKKRSQLEELQSFECYICKCSLDRHRTVRRHLKQHVAARDTKCQICSERFTSNELMQWHVCDTEMRYSQIMCEYCDESFESVAKCMEHLKIAHAYDQSMYQCRTCPRYFEMERLRDLHEKFFPHPTKSFQCDICSKQWIYKESFVRHLIKVHTGVVERPFLCSDCGKCFIGGQDLRRHMAVHKEPTIQCPVCPEKFHKDNAFKTHYEWHQNLKFHCNQCNRTFSTRKSLHVHMSKVHEKKSPSKKHECPDCGLKFMKVYRLRIHMRSHTGERPFECEVCEKSYRYKGDLTKHMQTHVGDNLHKCDLCHQAFRYHADMKRHRFAHYKEAKEKHGAAASELSKSVENQLFCSSTEETTTASLIPVTESPTIDIELQSPMDIETPDANEERDREACIDNEILENSSKSCVRCSSLKISETKLKIEIDEIQRKCQILRTENQKCKRRIEHCTHYALRLGQIKRYSRCELCLSLLFEDELRDHLCAGLTEIACENCVDAKFTSTLAITEHFASGIHADMRFQKCSQCSLGFRLNSFLKIHEKTHEQTNGTTTGIWYKCANCDESSDQPLDLVRHFKKYHQSKEPSERPSYECYICKCPLNRHSNVRRHLKQHVAARDTKCQICSERLTSNELMQWHICDTEMDCSRIQCEYCDESFQSVAKCMDHLKTAHADDKSMYQCRTCSRYFEMERLRDLHEKFFPHLTKSFQCDICSKQWIYKQSLKWHLEKVHCKGIVERSFLCSDCGKCFIEGRDLRRHMAVHKEPTIQCPVCPEKFHKETAFKTHYEWHQNLKFRCNQCNRTFAKRITLQTHISKVHEKRSQLKKHECPDCGLKFIKLRIHMRSHTGERPFECEVCEKSYRYKGDLTKHMQTHVGDNLYKCDLCHQAFRYYADMKQHRFAHYKEAKEKHGAAAQELSTSVEN